jgi:GAF domain-containing protein
MFETKPTTFKDKASRYKFLNYELNRLIQNESSALSNLCNSAALLWEFLENINWAGFYLVKNDELILGPFQGKPACVHIAIGSGVCGTAVKEKKSQVVPDVHNFPGHIACDSASNSEIVIPLIVDEKVVGVIDIDSPTFNTFTEEDHIGLKAFADLLIKHIDWQQL